MLASKNKRLLEDVISCYAGEATLEKVRKLGRKALMPSVEQKVATIYLQRWNGFSNTRINETFSPNDILECFSDYLSIFTSCIQQHHGLIIRVNENDITALFEADDISTQVNNASACALDCQGRIGDFSERWSQNHEAFSLIIGIDTGMVIMGNFGSEKGLYFNLIGQPVRTTELLVKQSAPGAGIVLSGNSGKELDSGYQTKTLDPIIVKGIPDPVSSYQLIGHA